ncbi:6-hydroxymethylpterin diphosphokinase MptE-like protein [Neptuniibacter sp. QD48_11]|uniref:motility associated factor glycosyltransferase family protein n=1 Tax=unclassified Neptuniibacter TaxID=2630693 RepID=UPI0039F507F1
MTDLDAAIAGAEKLSKKISASRLYEKNIAYIKDKLPSLYEFYLDYKPEKMQVGFDDAGNLNLVNASGVYVYPEDPEIFACKQVEAYKKKPTIKFLTFKNEAIDTGYIHQKLMGNLFQYYEEVKDGYYKALTACPNEIQTMIVMGVGAGFHIRDIAMNMSVRNLCIYDPHPETLFISFHLIDWQPIIEKYSQPGYNIEFCIGHSVRKSYAVLTSFFGRVGMFNVVRTFIFKHYDSLEVQELDSLLQNDLLKIAMGIGFYDDERVGLAHTMVNFRNDVSIARKSLINHKEQISNRTVVVVGNGPSLDENEDFLRSLQGRAYIISCGTALATLEKKGIKPDIHVEQERPKNVYDWLINSTSEEFRKGIRFVGLNTVYPDVFDLFDESYMVAKPNDLGGTFIFELLHRKPGNSLVLAEFANPTVTNFGASLSLTLGFKNIILVGVDLGMVTLDAHHSKDSSYEKKTEAHQNALKTAGVFERPGNFRDKIYTTNALDKSRISFEMLLDRFKQVNCVNINDGARIQGAHSCRAAEIEVVGEHPISFADELSNRFTTVFSLNGFHDFSEDAIQKHLAHVSIVLDRYRGLLQTKVNSLDDVYMVLREGHYALRKTKGLSFIARGLLKGTLEYVSCTYISILTMVKERDVPEYFAKLSGVVLPYLDQIEIDAKEKIFKKDEFSNYDIYHD